jgi:RND family efflux transporter MFP subunit
LKTTLALFPENYKKIYMNNIHHQAGIKHLTPACRQAGSTFNITTMQKLLILCVFAAMMLSCKQEQDNLGKDIAVPVTVSTVKFGTIEEYIDISGTVSPVKEVQIKAEVPGNYQLRNNSATGRSFALGDRVAASAEIIEISDKEYENNLKLNSLKLNLEITKQVFDKQQSLYDKGGVTLSELKNAEINYINANYSYEDALLRMQKMHVKAPFAGVIVDLPYFTPGVKVETNALLVKIMDYSKLHLEVNLPEKSMGKVRAGQLVRIINYNLPEDTLTGTITQISPAIDPETRSYLGIIVVNNPKLQLRPGMYVKGEIVVASAKHVVVIPKEIIVSKQRGNSVFVVEKGVALERVVEFGIENPREVEIISGLKEDEQLVIKGFETLRDRSKVKETK